MFCTSIWRNTPVPFQTIHYKKAFMHRLNSYLFCADTKATLIFLAKASICQIFQKTDYSFLSDSSFNCTRRFDQCVYALIKSHVYKHRQTQTWWHFQISGDFQNFPKSWMYAIGWRTTLYSMLYVRHPLWVRLLTIQPLCVPGTCRRFSFMSDLFHVRFIYLNGGILELL